MPETLVIRLLSATAPAARAELAAQWLLVDASGARLGATLQGTLTEAAGLAANRKVIVLVPGADALHVEPVLPPLKGGAKLNQLVPYALEDQLATDVDALHFAVGKRDTRPGTPVVVVSHDAMQAWIFALRAAGVTPDALFTDTSLLPEPDRGMALLIDESRVSSRTTSSPVNTLDVSPLSEALALLLPADIDTPIIIYIAESEYDVDQVTLEAVRQRMSDVQIKLLPDGVLPLLAMQAARQHGINLLQGVYTPRTNMRSRFTPWRYAAGLLVAWLLAHLLVQGAQLWRLRKQEVQLDQQIALTYSTGMPGTGPVAASDARRAFESRLLQFQASSRGSGLLLGLGTLTQVVGKTPELQLDAVSYRDNSVDLRIMAPNVDALEQIRQQAQAQGVSAEIQSANPKDNRIEGRVQLKLPQGA